MCDTDDDTDLMAFSDAALTDRLRIEIVNGRAVPRNKHGHIQERGFRRSPDPGDDATRLVWKSGHWEAWVPPE